MKRLLTVDEALEHIDFNDDMAHTYRNPAPSVLFGADLSKQEIRKELDLANIIEIGGDQCKGINHAIVVNGSLFIANKPSLLELDKCD